MEGFIDIQGYEGLYKINKDGVVYSTGRRAIPKLVEPALQGNSKGYRLSKDNKVKRFPVDYLLNVHFSTPQPVDSEEEWKEIEGYDGEYLVSNMGRVKSLKWGKEVMLSPVVIKSDGYCVVYLSKNNIKESILLHRLVAINFIPNPENKAEVNHKKGVKTQNKASELEWLTPSENMKHAFEVLGRESPKHWTGKTGREHNTSKPINQYTLEGVFVKEHDSIVSAAKEAGVSPSNISANLSGASSQSGGYVWRYKEKDQ